MMLQQKQIAVERRRAVIAKKPNTRSNIEMVKLPIFNRKTNQIVEFIIACRLYLRMKMRDVSVEEQVQ